MRKTIRAKVEGSSAVESFAIHWTRARVERAGVVSFPCSSIVVGDNGERYAVNFRALIITTQAVERPPVAFISVASCFIPQALNPGSLIEESSFMQAVYCYLIGHGPDGLPLMPVERADSFIPAVVSDVCSRITAASGWSVVAGFDAAHGWLKLSAVLGGRTRCTVSGPDVTAADIARLYCVPEVTRRALIDAAGAVWPADPPLEEVN